MLIVPVFYWHTHGQTRCSAVSLADFGTTVSLGLGPYTRDLWGTVEGSHAPPPMGVITDTLRASLRDLAQADARLYRGLAELTADTTAPALPATRADIAAAIALLEAHGYTVTR